MDLHRVAWCKSKSRVRAVATEAGIQTPHEGGVSHRIVLFLIACLECCGVGCLFVLVRACLRLEPATRPDFERIFSPRERYAFTVSAIARFRSRCAPSRTN